MNPTTLAVLKAIKQLTAERHGQPPSLREIAKMIPAQRGKETSTATVQHHIQDMVKLGLMTHRPRIARGLVLTAKGEREAAKNG